MDEAARRPACRRGHDELKKIRLAKIDAARAASARGRARSLEVRLNIATGYIASDEGRTERLDLALAARAIRRGGHPGSNRRVRHSLGWPSPSAFANEDLQHSGARAGRLRHALA